MKPFRRGIVSADPWEYAANKLAEKGGWAIVYTENNMEYKGRVHIMGIEENKREIVLRTPKGVVRDKDLNVVEEIEVGGDFRAITFTFASTTTK